MTTVPDPRLTMLIPAAVLALAATVGLVWLAGHLVRYARTPRPLRPVLRRAWRITYTWKRTARRVGLVQTERSCPPWWSNRPATEVIVRELVPAIRVAVEPWGVRVDASTVGKLGVDEFQNAASHLADVWRVGQVRVEQARPDPAACPDHRPPHQPHPVERRRHRLGWSRVVARRCRCRR